MSLYGITFKDIQANVTRRVRKVVIQPEELVYKVGLPSCWRWFDDDPFSGLAALSGFPYYIWRDKWNRWSIRDEYGFLQGGGYKQPMKAAKTAEALVEAEYDSRAELHGKCLNCS